MKMRLLIALVLGLQLLCEAHPANAASPATFRNNGLSPTSWLNQGSDVPADPAWRNATLSNGLRYAIKHSTQPPGTISIRVRVGVGGLMERDDQQGWSHLLEHLVFRGSKAFPDGEGLKIWQRLGATFGSDTNAATTLTSTTYQLDLPKADAKSLEDALSVLAGMMDNATIEPVALEAERKIVTAERAARLSPLALKFQDASQGLFYTGTLAATRNVIGSPETLAKADSTLLKAFYEAWYRPDNTVIAVAGDADPTMVAAAIDKAFGAWQPQGRQGVAPPSGNIESPVIPANVVTDAQAPDLAFVSFVGSMDERPVTVAIQRQRFVDRIAVAVLNQRFTASARRNEALVSARAQRLQQRLIADQLQVQMQVKPGGWQAALNQVFGVLNGVAINPPAQGEIDQQFDGIFSGWRQSVAGASTEPASQSASELIGNVDAGLANAAPQFYLDLLANLKPSLTPAVVRAALSRLLAPAPRLLVAGPQPLPGGADAAVAALNTARKAQATQLASDRALSLDQLVLGGAPAKVISSTDLARMDAHRTVFANGVELIFKRTSLEKERLRVRVEVGRGMLGEPREQPGLWWSAPALTEQGIGPFTPDDLGRLTAGRQTGFAIAPAFDALVLSGATTAADLELMLKLMAGQLAQPRFEASAVERFHTAILSNYPSIYSQPGAALQIFGGAALHGGDKRFAGLPPIEDVQKLSTADFQHFWSARLAQGPIRLVVVGDGDGEAIIAAVAKTLGTLPERPMVKVAAIGSLAPIPASLEHRGDPKQAIIVRAFPSFGVAQNIVAGVTLDLAAALVQNQLLERFRANEGGAYAPFANHAQTFVPDYGVFIAGAQVELSRVDEFARALATLLKGLADKGPSADALARAQATLIAAQERNEKNNGFWVSLLSTELSPTIQAQLLERATMVKSITAGGVKGVVRRYLQPRKEVEITVLPRAVK